MNLTADKITEIFVLVDDFRKEFKTFLSKYTLGNTPKRKPEMSQSDVITIMILFHFGAFKNLKHFYLYYVKEHMRLYFPQTVSYNRFVELLQSSVLPMTIVFKNMLFGGLHGYFFY